jgi:hypothetical protein
MLRINHTSKKRFSFNAVTALTTRKRQASSRRNYQSYNISMKLNYKQSKN